MLAPGAEKVANNTSNRQPLRWKNGNTRCVKAAIAKDEVGFGFIARVSPVLTFLSNNKE
jgi:hypothetical protein